MGSLVPLAVRIDVSRLIDRSQPFRAVQSPRLSPAPADFHPSEGVDKNLGRLHDAAASRHSGISPLVLLMRERTAFRGGRSALGCPCTTGWPILGLATADFERKTSFSG